MKTRFDLLPWDSIEDVAKVLQSSVEKYGEFTWQGKSVYGDIQAMLRHVIAYMQGDKIDESGHHALAHAVVRCLFILHKERRESVDIKPEIVGVVNDNIDSLITGSPKTWEGLQKSMNTEDWPWHMLDNDAICKYLDYFNNIGFYDVIDFNKKLTIRLGRKSEDEYCWQILYQDARFLNRDDCFECYKNIRSCRHIQIENIQIYLRGSSKFFDHNINIFTANTERIRDILTQLMDWSINYPGFKEE